MSAITPAASPWQRPLRLSFWALLLAALVVTLGAYTRLADAGLGCPDWPGCYGFVLVPHTDTHMQVAAERFPHAPVEHAKGWAEMIHRYAAGALGLLIAGLAACAWQRRGLRNYPHRLSAGLLLLVIVQALFGMWTVTLSLWPQVVVLHLLGGFATLTLLLLLYLRLRAAVVRPGPAVAQPLRRTLLPLALVALLLVLVQIVLGGWTSANYAAHACPDFPRCQQQWWPQSLSLRGGFDVLQPVGPNYQGGLMDGPERTAIHLVHRLGAVMVTAVVLALALALWRRERQGLALLLGLALVAQVAIGIANVLWQFPLWLALAHNTGAAVLLLSVTAVLCDLYGICPFRARIGKGVRYENPLVLP